MRVKYNTLPSYNPLSPAINLRFSVHPAATCESAAGHNVAGRRNLNSPTHPHPGCHPSAFCLAYPPPTCKGDLSPKQLHRKLCYLRNPFTPHRATA